MYNHPEILKDKRFQQVVDYNVADYNNRDNWHTPGCTVWYTTYTSIYNIATRSLSVKLHEGLDGMKEYLNFNFDQHFSKPLNKKK